MLTVPLKGLKTGRQLVQLRSLLVLHSFMEELTDSVHLLIAQVAIGTKVERRTGEFDEDAATSPS